MRRGAIDRVTAEDVVSLATDVGPVPMQVGVVLVLEPASALAPSRWRGPGGLASSGRPSSPPENAFAAASSARGTTT